MAVVEMYVKPMGGGAALAAVTMGVASLLPDPQARSFLAILLGLIAGVYVGFGLADGRSWERVLELLVALIFLTVAWLGLWESPMFLGAGYMAHGLWDLLHHPRRVPTFVTAWYPMTCSAFDMMVAGYIAYRWMLSG